MYSIIDQTILINGTDHHIEVTSPTGNGGGGYFVFVNKYFQAQIINYHGIGWTVALSTKDKPCILTADDWQVILDKVKEAEGD